MGILDSLRRLFSGGAGAGGSRSHTVYLRCQRCGEPLALRVDLANDLSPEWRDSSGGGSDYPDYYSARKTVIGSGRCYAPIEVEMVFSKQKQLESQSVKGGVLLTEEEYQQAQAEREARGSAE